MKSAPGAGDVAGGAEFRPTDASLQVLAGIETDLNKAQVEFKAFNDKDLATLNQLLRDEECGGAVSSWRLANSCETTASSNAGVPPPASH